MVKNPEILQEFEDKFTREHDTTFEQRLEIFEQMRLWAVKMGAFPRMDPYEGLQTIIDMARVLNYERFKDKPRFILKEYLEKENK